MSYIRVALYSDQRVALAAPALPWAAPQRQYRPRDAGLSADKDTPGTRATIGYFYPDPAGGLPVLLIRILSCAGALAPARAMPAACPSVRFLLSLAPTLGDHS